MTKNQRKQGFTLVEVLIVVVIMAVLAATIIPQFTVSTMDAKISTAEFNLNSLRQQIEMYRMQHDGAVPGATLAELSASTNAAGTIGTGAGFPFGPYLRSIPANPVTANDAIKVITNDPAESGDVTTNGGWLYNTTTGGIWIDHADHFDK